MGKAEIRKQQARGGSGTLSVVSKNPKEEGWAFWGHTDYKSWIIPVQGTHLYLVYMYPLGWEGGFSVSLELMEKNLLMNYDFSVVWGYISKTLTKYTLYTFT